MSNNGHINGRNKPETPRDHAKAILGNLEAQTAFLISDQLFQGIKPTAELRGNPLQAFFVPGVKILTQVCDITFYSEWEIVNDDQRARAYKQIRVFLNDEKDPLDSLDDIVMVLNATMRTVEDRRKELSALKAEPS